MPARTLDDLIPHQVRKSLACAPGVPNISIYRQIMGRGWSPARQAFVQHVDDEVLDAAVLMMP